MPVDRTDALGLAKAHRTVVGFAGAILGKPERCIKTVDGAAHIVTHIATGHAALHSGIRCSISAYCAAAWHTVGRTVADGRDETLQDRGKHFINIDQPIQNTGVVQKLGNIAGLHFTHITACGNLTDNVREVDRLAVLNVTAVHSTSVTASHTDLAFVQITGCQNGISTGSASDIRVLNGRHDHREGIQKSVKFNTFAQNIQTAAYRGCTADVHITYIAACIATTCDCVGAFIVEVGRRGCIFQIIRSRDDGVFQLGDVGIRNLCATGIAYEAACAAHGSVLCQLLCRNGKAVIGFHACILDVRHIGVYHAEKVTQVDIHTC